MSGKIQGLFSKHWKRAIVAAVLFASTFALYWPATGFDLLDFDDDRYVSGNQAVSSGLTIEGVRWAFRSVHEGYWLPLVWLSYMMDTTAFGTEPFGYHFTNVALHAANASLLFLLLYALTGAFWRSVFVAAFFAWHPLRVESVAWVAERKDVLSGFMLLICLFAYRSYARNPVTGREVPAVFFMAMGLMAKPILVTVPILLLLLDYWPLNRCSAAIADLRARIPRLFSEKGLFWALAIVFCLLTYYTQMKGGAVHGPDGNPWAQRLLAVPQAYIFYLWKTIRPVNLSMIYGDMDVSVPRALMSLLVLALITLMALLAGRRCRAIPVGWFWFLVSLMPVIGVVRVGAVHLADRFTYLATIGLGVGVAWGAADLMSRRRATGMILWILGVAVLAACGWQTRRVLPNWMSTTRAFENVLRHFPDNALANNSYGAALARGGDLKEAERYLRRAVRVNPRYASANKNLGNVLQATGRRAEAVYHYRMALETDANNVEALNNLAWLMATHPGASREDLAAAVRLAERAATLDGHANPAILNTLGKARAALRGAAE